MSSTLATAASRRLTTERPRGSGARLLLSGACLAAALAGGDARATPLHSGASIGIELRPSVAVAHAAVKLADVADLTIPDAAVRRRLADLSLGSAPGPGEVARLDRATLARWIQARTGIDPVELAWAGSSAVEIRTELTEVVGEAIAERAAEGVRGRLSASGLRVELRVAQQPPDIAVPPGRVDLRVRPLPEMQTFPKQLSAWVDVWVDERFVRAVPVRFDVAVFGPAYVALAPEPAGAILEPAALAVREVEWSGRSAPPVAPGEAAPLRLRRPVSAGAPVTRDQVEPAPLVTRGEWATLRVTEGMVTLESRVEVLEDGRAGQRVQVKVPDASGSIFARVTGPGALEVGP
jgi:flagellar basal body P-ring formation protein FlgA